MVNGKHTGQVARSMGLSLAFLALAACAAFLARTSLIPFFMTRPWLNGFILCVLMVGLVLSFFELARLLREARVLDRLQDNLKKSRGPDSSATNPEQVGPGIVGRRCRVLFSAVSVGRGLGTETAGVLSDADADSEEARSAFVRYLIGVMVFLGLIGTFWGLLITVGGVKEVLKALDPAHADDAAAFVAELKNSIGGLLGGMSTAFSTSLFGLSGSMLLGFVEVKTRQTRARFLADLDRFIVSQWLPRMAGEAAARQGKGPEIVTGPDGQRFRHLAVQETLGENLRLVADVMSQRAATDEKLATSLVEMKALLERLREEEIRTRERMDASTQLQRDLLDRLESMGGHMERLVTETRKGREAAKDSAKAIQERLAMEAKITNSTISQGFSDLLDRLETVLRAATSRTRSRDGGE